MYVCMYIYTNIYIYINRRGHLGSAVFHCILQPLKLHIFATTASAMVLSLLCNHWRFLLGFSAMANQNQNPKKNNKPRNQETKKQKNEKHTKWQDPTLCHYSPPWGVQSCFCFFLFFIFLVSWFFSFLFFWFVVGFLKGWQNNTKVKDLDLTLCQFAHFRGYKLAFGWFYWLLWACGSIRKSCKKTWQNAGITGGSLGADYSRQFCLFIYFFQNCVEHMQKHRQPMNMSNLFWYWHCWLKPLS